MSRVADDIIVTDLGAVAAGNAFLRVDPVFMIAESNGIHRTLHPTAMTTGTKGLIDLVSHKSSPFFCPILPCPHSMGSGWN
jgi:hypothetical protein